MSGWHQIECGCEEHDENFPRRRSWWDRRGDPWWETWGAWVIAGTIIAWLTLAVISVSYAHDPGQHPQLVGWAEEQLITKQHGARYGGTTGPVCPVPDVKNVQCLCCKDSEIVKAEYRLSKKLDLRGYPIDEYWYKRSGEDPRTGKEYEWKLIPDDVVHWNEHAPDGQPTLFIIGGNIERCFFPGVTQQ